MEDDAERASTDSSATLCPGLVMAIEPPTTTDGTTAANPDNNTQMEVTDAPDNRERSKSPTTPDENAEPEIRLNNPAPFDDPSTRIKYLVRFQRCYDELAANEAAKVTARQKQKKDDEAIVQKAREELAYHTEVIRKCEQSYEALNQEKMQIMATLKSLDKASERKRQYDAAYARSAAWVESGGQSRTPLSEQQQPQAAVSHQQLGLDATAEHQDQRNKLKRKNEESPVAESKKAKEGTDNLTQGAISNLGNINPAITNLIDRIYRQKQAQAEREREMLLTSTAPTSSQSARPVFSQSAPREGSLQTALQLPERPESRMAPPFPSFLPPNFVLPPQFRPYQQPPNNAATSQQLPSSSRSRYFTIPPEDPPCHYAPPLTREHADKLATELNFITSTLEQQKAQQSQLPAHSQMQPKLMQPPTNSPKQKRTTTKSRDAFPPLNSNAPKRNHPVLDDIASGVSRTNRSASGMSEDPNAINQRNLEQRAAATSGWTGAGAESRDVPPAVTSSTPQAGSSNPQTISLNVPITVGKLMSPLVPPNTKMIPGTPVILHSLPPEFQPMAQPMTLLPQQQPLRQQPPQQQPPPQQPPPPQQQPPQQQPPPQQPPPQQQPPQQPPPQQPPPQQPPPQQPPQQPPVITTELLYRILLANLSANGGAGSK